MLLEGDLAQAEPLCALAASGAPGAKDNGDPVGRDGTPCLVCPSQRAQAWAPAGAVQGAGKGTACSLNSARLSVTRTAAAVPPLWWVPRERAPAARAQARCPRDSAGLRAPVLREIAS